MTTSRLSAARAMVAVLVVGIGGALGGASCGTALSANTPASRTNLPDRCATMSCPTGSHCEADGAGGARCQSDPSPQGALPRFP
jgi:hypothetical protein